MNYDKIKKEIKDFVDERDWEQFHTPKNLSMALSVEASELLNEIEGIAVCHLTSADVVRHQLVQRVVDAYARLDKRKPRR